MRFTWANISERRICVSNFSVTCNRFREFYTLDWFLHVWALPENGLRRLHVLKHTTLLACIRWSTSSRSSFQLMTGVTILVRSPRSVVTFVTVDNRLPYVFMPIILLQHSYCTLVIILFGPFTRLFINLMVCIRALLSKPTTTLGLVEQAFWRMPFFTEWSGANSFEVILTRQSSHCPTWASASRTSGSRCIFHALLRRSSRRRIRLCRFCTLIHIVSETAIVSFRTLPLAFHCRQSPRILCTRCFVPWFLTTALVSKFPFLASKFVILKLCSILFFTIVFNLWWSGLAFFWWISTLYNSNTVSSFTDSRILYLYKLSKMSSDGTCVIDFKIPSHFESNSWVSSFRRTTGIKSA